VDALQFAKYQALGNDFIVIDARGRPGDVDDEALSVRLPDSALAPTT
jgi:diaminopimelate epimerase